MCFIFVGGLWVGVCYRVNGIWFCPTHTCPEFVEGSQPFAKPKEPGKNKEYEVWKRKAN
jgi:hypothetical protein